ncbi:hypothetical protein CPB84DRAFT_1849873 [Gymnopilus junonius]|uniref:Uncharacterized protein n=1 Tax=Gymnopilus junonius TaxID=109634 RepID=A0A9P5TK61_GYMJU|nr:hypothetical protein CPB84DRAFT_1849873 [Gymnopilus junonius]
MLHEPEGSDILDINFNIPDMKGMKEEEKEMVGLGMRIEVWIVAVTVVQRDSSISPFPVPMLSISSLMALLAPVATSALPATSEYLLLQLTPPMSTFMLAAVALNAALSQFLPPSVLTPSAAALNALPSPFPLTSFTNLSLLSPALLNGPHTFIPSSLQLQNAIGEKTPLRYPFPHERAESPSPSHLDEAWIPLWRVEPDEKLVMMVQQWKAVGSRVQQDVAEELTREECESSIMSYSGGVPLPVATIEEKGQ